MRCIHDTLLVQMRCINDTLLVQMRCINDTLLVQMRCIHDTLLVQISCINDTLLVQMRCINNTLLVQMRCISTIHSWFRWDVSMIHSCKTLMILESLEVILDVKSNTSLLLAMYRVFWYPCFSQNVSPYISFDVNFFTIEFFNCGVPHFLIVMKCCLTWYEQVITYIGVWWHFINAAVATCL